MSRHPPPPFAVGLHEYANRLLPPRPSAPLTRVPCAALDTWDLAEYANPPFDAAADGNLAACKLAYGDDGCVSANPVYPAYNRQLCAALQPLLILCGTVPRFYLGELRKPSKKNAVFGQKDMSNKFYYFLVFVGVVFWCGGFAIWYTCSRAVYDRLYKDGLVEDRYWNGGFPEGRWRETDQLWIGRLIWLQLGYPIISIIEFLWVGLASRGLFFQRVEANSYPAALSTLKDLFYGIFDVLTKGGLAMYVASRAAYL